MTERRDWIEVVTAVMALALVLVATPAHAQKAHTRVAREVISTSELAWFCGPMRQQSEWYTDDFIATKNSAGTEAAYTGGFCEGFIVAVATADQLELDADETYGPGFAKWMHDRPFNPFIEKQPADITVHMYLVWERHCPKRPR